MRTELQSGAWVEHRPITDLKAKDKDAMARVTRYTLPEGLSVAELDGDLDVSALAAGLDVMAFSLAQRNAVLARIITAWSYDLPVPVVEGAAIIGEESIGEIPLDDFAQIEELLAPYIAKLQRRPDPKGATISSSNGSSKASPRGSHRA